jgi:hypothetical protein
MNLWWQAVDGWRCIAFLGGGCAVGQVGLERRCQERYKDEPGVVGGERKAVRAQRNRPKFLQISGFLGSISKV